MATINVTNAQTFVSGDTVTPQTLNALGVPTVTVSDIVNADIASAADISGSKLAATSVAAGKLETALDLSGKTLTMPTGHWLALAPTGAVFNTQVATLATYQTITATTSYDDNAPAITSGAEILTVSITPASLSSKILLTFNCMADSGTNQVTTASLHRNTGAAIRATSLDSYPATLFMACLDSPNTTSAITYRVRVGVSGNSIGINGNSSARKLGGAAAAVLIAQEIKA